MPQRRDDEWVRYWRSADGLVEAMHARFLGHVYHRHSHETYSFGVTDLGAQSFRCRGGEHTSAAGMVMAFNPDDPHDGRASDGVGFVYRMVHVAPALVADVLADRTGRRPCLPLFIEPVIQDDPLLARSLRRLHTALAGGSALERDQHLAATIVALAIGGSTAPTRAPASQHVTGRDAARVAAQVRALLDEAYVEDLGATDLAAAVGRSRYVVYRAFEATYGLAPSAYQRQRRLRAARRLLAVGNRPADVAAEVGFADQAHLTRWFVRSFGLTPSDYSRAVRLPR